MELVTGSSAGAKLRSLISLCGVQSGLAMERIGQRRDHAPQLSPFLSLPPGAAEQQGLSTLHSISALQTAKSSVDC